MSNIIFLDIDGPLLPGKLHLMKQNRAPRKDNPPVFDNFAVIAFNLWAKYSNAKVVFSTNWSLQFSNDELKNIMSINGLMLEYHDEVTTPKRFSSSRHSEILSWLEDNAVAGDTFIAVDDDQSCQYINESLRTYHAQLDIKGEWIETNFRDGLTLQNFQDGCRVLGISSDDINEQEFGIKRLTDEEKAQREKDLELLVRCIV